MYYEAYEQKMQKLARIRDKIYKLRFLILGIFLAVVALVVGAFSFKGKFFGDLQLSDRYVYGETIAPRATAFLSKVDYEYSDGDAWTTEQPILPGEYRVRALAKKSFGGVEYSEERSFVIEKKPLSVDMASSTVYGEDPKLSVSGLVRGDTLAEGARFTFGDILTEQPWVMLEKNSFTIVGANGSVMTDGYAIEEKTFERTSITLRPRPIMLRISDAEKMYDGTALASDKWSISSGELIPGDRILVNCLGEQLLVGKSENGAEIALTNERGEDISALYNVTLKTGVLKVTKRPIEIATATAEKLYDGEALYADTFTVTSEIGAADNEFLQLVSYPELLDAGEKKNTLAVAVTTEEGEERTDCYAIAYAYGILTVRQRSIVIRFENDEKLYDGAVYADMVWGICDGDGFVKEEKITSAEPYAMQNDKFVNAKDAGEYTLTMRQIFVGDPSSGRDTTNNYSFSYQTGLLTVLKRTAIFWLDNAEKIYDGLPYSVSDSAGVYSLDENYPLATNEYSYVLQVDAGEYVDAGVYENAVRVDIQVRDLWGRDTTHNYDVVLTSHNKDFGLTLTIKKRPLAVCLLERERPYDGTPLTSNAYGIKTDGRYLLPADGHSVEVMADGSITEVGETENKVMGVTVTQEGVDVTYNYEVVASDSILRVVKRMVTVKPLSYRKIYDGVEVDFKEALFLYPVWTREEDRQYGSSLLAGDVLYGEASPQVALQAGFYRSYVAINTFRIENGRGMDVTNEYYEVTFAVGEVEIAARDVYVESRDVEAIYTEGTVLKGSAEDCRIVKGSLVGGDTIEYVVTAQIDNVGSRINRIRSVIIRNKEGDIKGKALFDENGNMTEGNNGAWLGYNYRIFATCGRLTLYSERVSAAAF